MRAAVLVAITLIAAVELQAQDAPTLLARGDSAAWASQHREAIDRYEAALALAPELRKSVLHRLGRQYLWTDRPGHAAWLLMELLGEEPQNCEARLDLALAYAWANRIETARRTYLDVQAHCPALRGEATLGEARMLRWSNRSIAAEQVYERLLTDGDEAVRRQAEAGLATSRLDTYEPGEALRRFRGLIGRGNRTAEVHEGAVQASLDLSQRRGALQLLAEARSMGVSSGGLDRLEEQARWLGRPTVSTMAAGFQDGDGTAYRAAGIRSGFVFADDGVGEAGLRRWSLQGHGEAVDAFGVDGAATLPLRSIWRLTVRAEAHQLTAVPSPRFGGAAGVAWLPDDRTRLDVTVARLLVLDHLEALERGLGGTLLELGASHRITRWTAIAGAVDVTRWSDGNIRSRLRFAPSHRFQGLPMVTVEWPSLYQHYTEPFDFGFFSPPGYFETGPGINVYRRHRRVWHLSAYGRAGVQREVGTDWRGLGAVRLSLEREVTRHFGLRTDATWTNSNLGGSSGFERSSLAASITGRF